MSKTYKFSKATFENLVKHLLDIEEGKTNSSMNTFRNPTKNAEILKNSSMIMSSRSITWYAMPASQKKSMMCFPL